MAITAFTDLISISLVMGVMLILDLIGYVVKIGVLHIAAGILGMYTISQIVSNQGITYMTVYNQATGTFSSQTIDPNLITAVLVILTMVSFLFLFYEKYGD